MQACQERKFALELQRALSELDEQIRVTVLFDYDDAVVVVRSLPDPPSLARDLSARLGGVFVVAAESVTWVVGRRHVVILEEEEFKQVLAAREVCRSLSVEGGYTVGACARRLLKFWSDGDDLVDSYTLDAFSAGEWGYIDCKPCRLDFAMQFDAVSYYFQLFARVHAPTVYVRGGRLVWGACTADELSRHRDLCDAVAAHKRLRNALVGVGKGAGSEQVCYVKGEERILKFARSSHVNVCSLIVRSAHEMTLRASHEVDSVYTHTDCVTTPASSSVPVWDEVGVAYRLRAVGVTEVKNMVTYRCGSRVTGGWSDEATLEAVPRRAIGCEWFRCWL